MHFGVWFKRTFKVNVPQVFYEHLKNNSNICDENCALYKEDEVISCTEKCDSIIDKGFCIIGHWDNNIIILRAKDEKVFIVDSKNWMKISAWFCNITTFKNLCKLNRIQEIR